MTKSLQLSGIHLVALLFMLSSSLPPSASLLTLSLHYTINCEMCGHQGPRIDLPHFCTKRGGQLIGLDPETVDDVDGFLEGEGGDFAPSLSNNAATWLRVLPSNPS